mmetsp:Transcript_78712/g.138872  ORF Transcript_78712/g.138872 Transcript_78712/m.138872 type:complete len:305 (-) Transcript_78712:30-944(-)
MGYGKGKGHKGWYEWSSNDWGWRRNDWSCDARQGWNENTRVSGKGKQEWKPMAPKPLVKDKSALPWKPFVEDVSRWSFAYVLPRASSGLTEAQLLAWFQALHPQNLSSAGDCWTDAAFNGRKLLRKTGWYVWPPCQCAYEYADTNQGIISNPEMKAAIHEISACIFRLCGVEDNPPNSVNLNFYPEGGGVGFHADDEKLFDGLNQETCIISLSLCDKHASSPQGSRWFEVKLKKPWGSEVKALELQHGDLMTMEGFFQKHYLHSAWPGDRDDIVEAPELGRWALGERINLTWRYIVRHNPSCPA